SPKDGPRAIVEVQPVYGTITHHTVLFQTITSEPEGFFECPVLVKTNWQPIWAGGRNTNGLVLPQGVGFQIDADTQYLVQLHLLHGGTGPVTEGSAVNLRYADPAGLQPAGIFALGTFSLNIPAGAMNFQQVKSCTADRQMHVFAAFPHMHKLGKRL